MDLAAAPFSRNIPKFYEPNLRAGFVLKFKSCGITHVMSHDFRGVGVPYMERGERSNVILPN